MRKLFTFILVFVLMSMSVWAIEPLFFSLDTEYTDGSSVEIDIDVTDYASGQSIFSQKTNGIVKNGKLEFYVGLDTQVWYNIPDGNVTNDWYVNLTIEGQPDYTNYSVMNQIQSSQSRLINLPSNEYSPMTINANGQGYNSSMFGNSYNDWWIVKVTETTGYGDFTDDAGNVVNFTEVGTFWVVKYNSKWYIIGVEGRGSPQQQGR